MELPSTRFHVSPRLGGGGSKQRAGARGWRWEQPSAGGSAQGKGNGGRRERQAGSKRQRPPSDPSQSWSSPCGETE